MYPGGNHREQFPGLYRGPCPGPRGAGNGKSGSSPEYLNYSVDIRTESKKNFQSVMDDLGEKLEIHELDTLFSTNHFV